jgi:FlaA1/EpsC-like NDP-sugar epimerase
MINNNKEKIEKRRKPLLEHWQVIAILLAVYDIIAVNFSYIFALWLRFDCRFLSIPEYYLHAWVQFVPIYTVFCLIVFLLLRLYNSIWRFASFSELLRVLLSSAITAVFHVVMITVLFRRMPIFYYVVGAFIQFILVIGIRFSYRFLLMLRDRNPPNGKRADRVMIIGAGRAGQQLLRDLRRADNATHKVVCIIDDNPISGAATWTE